MLLPLASRPEPEAEPLGDCPAEPEARLELLEEEGETEALPDCELLPLLLRLGCQVLEPSLLLPEGLRLPVPELLALAAWEPDRQALMELSREALADKEGALALAQEEALLVREGREVLEGTSLMLAPV